MRDGRVFGLRLATLLLVAALVAAAIAYRGWLTAQARAAVVLSVVLEAPVAEWTVGRVTPEPHVEDVEFAGLPTTLARSSGDGPWPTIVFLNGATARGRQHPRVQALARGLARAGYLVLVPDLPGLRRGEITTRTLAAALAVVEAAVRSPDTRGDVALLGVSAGATLALLVAEDPELADRISVVGAIAPYTDLAEVVRLATTGYYERDGKLVRYEAEEFVSLAVARSLVAGLPPGRDRDALVARLRAVESDAADPLAAVREARRGALGPGTRALVAVLVNDDPRRFDSLYARLPRALRAEHRRLSPIVRARRIRAPVEIASAPHDKYFPVAESQALARANPRVRVTVTRTLAHAIPEASVRDVADLLAFEAFVVRVLDRSA